MLGTWFQCREKLNSKISELADTSEFVCVHCASMFGALLILIRLHVCLKGHHLCMDDKIDCHKFVETKQQQQNKEKRNLSKQMVLNYF